MPSEARSRARPPKAPTGIKGLTRKPSRPFGAASAFCPVGGAPSSGAFAAGFSRIARHETGGLRSKIREKGFTAPPRPISRLPERGWGEDRSGGARAAGGEPLSRRPERAGEGIHRAARLQLTGERVGARTEAAARERREGSRSRARPERAKARNASLAMDAPLMAGDARRGQRKRIRLRRRLLPQGRRFRECARREGRRSLEWRARSCRLSLDWSLRELWRFRGPGRAARCQRKTRRPTSPPRRP